jgi:hypothetical protein
VDDNPTPNQERDPRRGREPRRFVSLVEQFHRRADQRRPHANGERAHETPLVAVTRRLVRATWLLVVIGFLSVGAAGLQWLALRSTDEKTGKNLVAMREQLGVMRDQGKAMQGQLRMLQQQVIDAREMQRAFITASDYKITKIVAGDPNQSCWRFQPIISNAGGSPTVELRYVIQVVFIALRRPGEQGSAWDLILAPTDPDTVFQQSGGWDGALLGPKQNLPDTPANDRVCLTKDDSPYIFAPQRVYARGAIHYHDRYPGTPEHITKYCFWIRAIEDGSGWRPEPALCSHWNCADEECKRDEDAYADEVAETFKNAGQTPEPPAEFFPQ